ncbi:collagen alpha-1(I) chain-like [Equus quagga]|uniref:collagen alpha-1(I) chain-like n=1 Tax=Equus quagga TaxID=89248 RepID=UPI001EE2F9CB|nr:collagen alpha-1(I) chain-like [Equus quagga]
MRPRRPCKGLTEGGAAGTLGPRKEVQFPDLAPGMPRGLPLPCNSNWRAREEARGQEPPWPPCSGAQRPQSRQPAPPGQPGARSQGAEAGPQGCGPGDRRTARRAPSRSGTTARRRRAPCGWRAAGLHVARWLLWSYRPCRLQIPALRRQSLSGLPAGLRSGERQIGVGPAAPRHQGPPRPGQGWWRGHRGGWNCARGAPLGISGSVRGGLAHHPFAKRPLRGLGARGRGRDRDPKCQRPRRPQGGSGAERAPGRRHLCGDASLHYPLTQPGDTANPGPARHRPPPGLASCQERTAQDGGQARGLRPPTAVAARPSLGLRFRAPVMGAKRRRLGWLGSATRFPRRSIP